MSAQRLSALFFCQFCSLGIDLKFKFLACLLWNELLVKHQSLCPSFFSNVFIFLGFSRFFMIVFYRKWCAAPLRPGVKKSFFFLNNFSVVLKVNERSHDSDIGPVKFWLIF